MSSIAAQYAVDNEQDEGIWKRVRKKVTGFAKVVREVSQIPTYLVKDKDEEKILGGIKEEESREEVIKEAELPSETEWLKTSIIVPYISKNGKKRIAKICDKQELDLRFDRIKGEEAEKQYLKPGEIFLASGDGRITQITITGVSPEYSGIDILADVDTVLGFPTYKAEKPHPIN